jgi:hypothetical protein
LNASDGADGERRWLVAGRPVLPSLVVDGAAIPVLHVSQIAAALGLPLPPSGTPLLDGRDAAAILHAWLGHLAALSWERLLDPTPSRGRSLRNLTVNVFHPFELLPAAWHTGESDWRPEEDEARERRLTNREALLRFATAAATGWHSFLDARGDELGDRDPPVSTPRGTVSFSALLAFQRWHAAYHYRQLVDVAGVRDPLDLASFALALPNEIY